MNQVSEAWEDLGYESKPLEVKNPYRHFKSAKRYSHEPKEVTDVRRQNNLDLLELLRPHCRHYEIQGGTVRLNIRGRKYEFWPSIDCYYSHPLQKFTNNIPEFVSVCLSALGEKVK